VVRYLGRHGDNNVAKAAIISAVPPLMVKTPANPMGSPKAVFDDLQAQLFANRAKFYYDLPAGPFYGFNRPGVKLSTKFCEMIPDAFAEAASKTGTDVMLEEWQGMHHVFVLNTQQLGSARRALDHAAAFLKKQWNT
jgi:hypothetical protein